MNVFSNIRSGVDLGDGERTGRMTRIASSFFFLLSTSSSSFYGKNKLGKRDTYKKF